jgi:carbon storage regulator
MLVIRRRPGETVVIGENIEVEVLDATPSHVKLGIRAPKSVPVLRKEILLTRDQNLASARQLSLTALRRLSDSLKKPPHSPISAV